MSCIGEAQKVLPGVLDDVERVNYYSGYLREMLAAIIEDGVDVRSYFAWTLADNWEWADGFGTRFGVSFTQKDEDGRVVKYWPKRSAQVVTEWFEKHMI